MQDRRLCVLNAGSSSLKFAVYVVADDGILRRSQNGEVECVGGNGRLLVNAADGKIMHDRMVTTNGHASALAELAALADGPLQEGDLIGFGHRVVHGGPDMAMPTLVDAVTMARIEALEPLAPLHNPPAVAVLKALVQRFPHLPQIACFDTAFHRGHPAVADRFAIPDAMYQEGVRRYGFHGLSYEYIAGALTSQAPEIASGRIVVAHLGSGASMCALSGGRSVTPRWGSPPWTDCRWGRDQVRSMPASSYGCNNRKAGVSIASSSSSTSAAD
jgi:acetate kinase